MKHFPNDSPFRVAVIGAGLAGLSAARRLSREGLGVSLFEGSDRAGGRVRSLRNHFAPGLCVELGAEFIDSRHVEILELVCELGFDLIDSQAPGEESLGESWHFSGSMKSELEILHEFKPLAARMRVDFSRLSSNPSALVHKTADVRLDQLSITDYLRSIGAKNWFLDLLETAYATEYGLPASAQSSLNLLSLLSLDAAGEFRVFGDSDERYKLLGGNDQIAQAMARELGDSVHFQHRLQAVRPCGLGFELDFGHKGRVEAEFVILAMPFSTLREIDLQLDLPAAKRLAIDRLGYGANEKLIVGLNQSCWREQRKNGVSFTDLSFQSG